LLQESRQLKDLETYVKSVLTLKRVRKVEHPTVEHLFELCSSKNMLIDLTSSACSLEVEMKNEIDSIASGHRRKLEKDLKNVLKLLKWPLTTETDSLNQNYTSDLKSLIAQMTKLQFSFNESTSGVLWFITILTKPILLRFKYHFSGDRETNRIDKPEWYLDFITSMLKYHMEFLVNAVHPAMEMGSVDIIFHFARSLILGVHAHLESKWDLIKSSKELLCHTIDEMVAADFTIYSQFGYKRNTHNIDELALLESHDLVHDLIWPSITAFLISDLNRFSVWIQSDLDFGMSKLHSILEEDPHAWDTLGKNLNHETKSSMYVPECCENLICALKAVMQRYETLPKFHQLLYLKMVLDPFVGHIIESIRNKMLDSLPEIDFETGKQSIIPTVIPLNAAFQINKAFQVLQETDLMLELCQYETDFSHHPAFKAKYRHFVGEKSKNLFHKTFSANFEDHISHLNQVIDNQLSTLSNVCANEFIKRCGGYVKKCRRSGWLNTTDTVSEELVNAVKSLDTIASIMSLSLQGSLAMIFARTLSVLLIDFFVKNCIQGCRFDHSGGKKLENDFSCICSPFLKFTKHPENLLFRKLREYVKILSLPLPSLASLRGALRSIDSNDNCRDILEDGYQIVSLQGSDAQQLSKLRSDLI